MPGAGAEVLSRSTLLIVAFALAGSIGGLLLGRWVATPEASPPPPGVVVAAPGDVLPETTLEDLSGAPSHLSGWHGRALLINFWATWCAPCIEEMPVLDAFRSAQPPDGVEVLGIALDEPAAVRAFLAESVQVAYPILLGGAPGPGDLSVQLGNSHSVLPFSVLVDAEHRIVATRFGDFDADELDAWVAEHL